MVHLFSLSSCTVSCSTLSVSPPLRANTTSVTEGTVVGFTCDSGYRLTGHDHLDCETSGHWSAGIPTCVKGLWENQPIVHCSWRTHIENKNYGVLNPRSQGPKNFSREPEVVHTREHYIVHVLMESIWLVSLACQRLLTLGVHAR